MSDEATRNANFQATRRTETEELRDRIAVLERENANLASMWNDVNWSRTLYHQRLTALESAAREMLEAIHGTIVMTDNARRTLDAQSALDALLNTETEKP